MNYLTNYYKNLCEQLEQKINYLESHLNEARKAMNVKTGRMVPVRRVDVQDFDPYTGEDVPMMMGQYADGRGKGAQKTREVQFYPGEAVPNLTRSQESEAAYVLTDPGANTWGGNRTFSDAIGSGFLRGQGAPMDIVASELSEIRPRKAGSAARGRGKKSMKKKMAIIRAKYKDKSVNEAMLNEIERMINEELD